MGNYSISPQFGSVNATVGQPTSFFFYIFAANATIPPAVGSPVIFSGPSWLKSDGGTVGAAATFGCKGTPTVAGIQSATFTVQAPDGNYYCTVTFNVTGGTSPTQPPIAASLTASPQSFSGAANQVTTAPFALQVGGVSAGTPNRLILAQSPSWFDVLVGGVSLTTSGIAVTGNGSFSATAVLNSPPSGVTTASAMLQLVNSSYLPPAPSPVHPGIALSPGALQVGVIAQIALSLTVTGGILPPTLPPGQVTVPTNLTWFQARYLAQTANLKIRRNGWLDHYIYYTTGIWWIQFRDATTKVLGTLRVVQAGDWNEANFRAGDWTSDDTVDQTILAAAQAITTTYP